VDDTIMCGNHPGKDKAREETTVCMLMLFSGFLLKLAGFKHGTMSFHPTIKNVGLHRTPEAPFQFRDWVASILQEWDFDNVCTAHMGNKIGGAKQQLQEILQRAEPLFQKLSESNKKKQPSGTATEGDHQIVVSGNECG
jgi:hypothetical protein